MSTVYPYCIPWNHTGQPAASVPGGFSDDGLPIGVQLVGRPNDESTLLSLAAQIEAERPWADRPPPVSCTAREVRIHDTLTAGSEPLEPRDPGKVGIYACGPTVYGRIHVGNARPFVVFALLKRFLEHEGYEVTLVANVTDVNDKIYDAAARARGAERASWPSEMTAAYIEDTDRLGLGRPDRSPRPARRSSRSSS